MLPRLAPLLAGVVLAVGCTDAAQPTTGEASPVAATSGGAPAADVADEPPPVPTVESGTLTACMAPTPGVAELVAGEWQGFDAAVLAAVAAELDLVLEVVATSVDDVVTGVALGSGVCDVAAGGLVDGPALAGIGLTSVGYRTVHHVVVAVGPGSLVEPHEVTGSVGVVQGTPAAVSRAALAAATVVDYPSRADLALALSSGAVDAALVSVGGHDALAALVDGELSLRSAVPTSDQTVLLLSPTAPDDLVEALDAALEHLQATGRLDELRDSWLHD